MDIHVDDYGTIIRATIVEDGTALDISTATVKKFYIQKPGTTSPDEYTAEFYTDGSDGIIQYTTEDGDLDTVGLWKIQAYIEMTGWVGRSDIVGFKVKENLE